MVLTNYTWVARTPWQFHYGPSHESRCDEDMTPMHMTMFGAWDGGEGGQQGCPSQEGGPRLIRFESQRWRPKATKVRARLRV